MEQRTNQERERLEMLVQIRYSLNKNIKNITRYRNYD